MSIVIRQRTTQSRDPSNANTVSADISQTQHWRQPKWWHKRREGYPYAKGREAWPELPLRRLRICQWNLTMTSNTSKNWINMFRDSTSIHVLVFSRLITLLVQLAWPIMPTSFLPLRDLLTYVVSDKSISRNDYLSSLLAHAISLTFYHGSRKSLTCSRRSLPLLYPFR